MPSYFDRRTIGGADPSRNRMPSGHRNAGAPAQFALIDPSQQQNRGQQERHQPSQSSFTPPGFGGYGRDNTSGSVPPPPARSYDPPGFRCTRCGHSFISQAELDRHSFVCGAAALLTGMFTPYPAQQGDRYQQPPPYSPTPHGSGGYQHRNHNQYRCV